jgi:hypothetical protein
MMSERAHIKDPRVRRLTDAFIQTRKREIGEMEALMVALQNSPPASGTPDLPTQRAMPVPLLGEVLQGSSLA